ncbi:MAG: CPBP family intramembrane glutamic endopeptidase [Pseudomonadota bacterium]
MNFTRSLLFFGLPGIAIIAGVYLGVPLATDHGIALIISWTAAIWLPIVTMLAWVVFQHRQSASALSFRERFWLTKPTKEAWIAIFAGFLTLQLCEILLASTGTYFAQFPFFAPPEIIPELFDPRLDISQGLASFLGVPVRGNWWLVLFWLGWLVINIGGEELLWRGYALPLQQRYFGKWAWLINGLCWNLLVHAFMRWNFLTLMPISLVIPFLVQRYQNSWIGIAIHGLGNALVLAILIPSIAGWL